jgi:hypothetical protein
VRNKPALRVRRSGAAVVAAGIAFVGTVPLAGVRWELSPILLVPLLVGIWAWRSGTDVYPDRLKVRALIGSTSVPWDRITELAPDRQERITALLDNGNLIRLTGVTVGNLPVVLKAADRDAPVTDSVVTDDAVEERSAGDEPA